MNPAVYDAVETSTHDLPLWRALGAKSLSPVLELGTGTGRVAADLAARGVSVVGVDQSSEMLAFAREKWRSLSGVRWVEADVRELQLGAAFDVVLAPARVMEALGEPEVCLQALRRVRSHVQPGGCLALHVSLPPAPWQHEVSAVGLDRLGEHVWEERLDRSRRVRTVTMTRRTAFGVDRWGPVRLWWMPELEWKLVLDQAGFFVVSSWRGVCAKAVRADPSERYLLAVPA